VIELEVFIHGIPDSPNATRRRHWSSDADTVKVWRELAGWSTRSAVRHHGDADFFPLRKVALELVFFLVRANRDLDGLVASAKPLIDGVVDGGAMLGDSVTTVQSVSATWRRASEAGVSIRVKELP